MSIILGITGTFEGYASSPLYLYNNGTWSNLQTTGTTRTWDSGGNYAIDQLYCSDTNNRLEFSGKANGNNSGNITMYANFRLNQTINLTSYSYLKMNVTKFTRALKIIIGVSTDASLTSFSYSASYTATTTGVAIANISSLSGNYYIYMGVSCDLLFAYQNKFSIYVTQLFLSNS